jgi:hypothetical protein
MRMVKGTRARRLTFFGFTGLALGLIAGCAGGQTGDLSGERDDGPEQESVDGASGCDVHKQLLGSFDDMTDAGSANQLLDYAEQSFEAPIGWKAPASGQSWSIGPESGQGTLHVDVVRGDKAYLLTYSPHQNTGSGAGIEIGMVCPPPQLGVEANVSVTTDGGALAESYDTLLRSSALGVAVFSVPFDPSAVNGTLTISSSKPNAKLVQLSLDAALTTDGMTGKLAGIEQVELGSGPDGAVSGQPVTLAVWPDSAACSGTGEGFGVPLAAEALGVTGEATLASVATEEPVAITWRSGEATTLEVGVQSEGDGCFKVRDNLAFDQSGGPSVTYPVLITLKSADGRVDGSYPGTVVATGYDAEREVVAEAWVNVAVSDVEQLGFESLDVPTDAEALQLRIASSRSGGGASGSVRLVSLTNPPCSSEPIPEPEPGQGASTPGCPGQTPTELESVSWGD